MSNPVSKEPKVANVPNLRFAYSEDIAPRNLSFFLEVRSERNTKGLFDKNDVLSVSGDSGIVNQIELLGRSYAGESVLLYHVVEVNDIVYTKSPLASNPYGIIKTNGYKAGIVSTLYAVYKAKTNCNPFFVQHYFDYKPRINKYLRPIVRIGAKHDMKIGNQEVLENTVFFPSVQEQNEIVSFLELVNERIETQNKIIETLNSLIKPFFDAIPVTACEKFALCKLGRCVPAETMSWDDMTDDGAPAIIYGQLFTDYSLIIDEVHGRSSKRGCLSSGNDVLFPASTTVDNLSLISPASLKIKGVNLGGDMFSLSLHDWVDSDYLSLLINLDYRRDLAKLAQGSTIIHLHWEDIKDFELPLPSLADQKRVAAACKCVLERIKIEKVLLNKLIIRKQFLLKNMFI